MGRLRLGDLWADARVAKKNLYLLVTRLPQLASTFEKTITGKRHEKGFHAQESTARAVAELIPARHLWRAPEDLNTAEVFEEAPETAKEATNAVEEASDHEAAETSPEAAASTEPPTASTEPPTASTEPPTAIITRSFKGLVIERRDSDGYFNGTNLCAAFKKTFDNYLQTQRVSAYLDALAHLLLSTSRFREVDFDEARASIVQVQNGGASRGSWIHERVAMDLACWLSPDFAVWLDGWVLEAWVSHRSPRCLHCRCPRSQSMPLPPSKSVRDSSFRRTWRSGPSNNSEQKQR